MKCQIFIDILLLIGVVYLFSMCSNNGGRNTYNINHYVDTINGHIILTTVCDNNTSGVVSVSTLELNDN